MNNLFFKKSKKLFREFKKRIFKLLYKENKLTGYYSKRSKFNFYE